MIDGFNGVASPAQNVACPRGPAEPALRAHARARGGEGALNQRGGQHVQYDLRRGCRRGQDSETSVFTLDADALSDTLHEHPWSRTKCTSGGGSNDRCTTADSHLLERDGMPLERSSPCIGRVSVDA